MPAYNRNALFEFVHHEEIKKIYRHRIDWHYTTTRRSMLTQSNYNDERQRPATMEQPKSGKNRIERWIIIIKRQQNGMANGNIARRVSRIGHVGVITQSPIHSNVLHTFCIPDYGIGIGNCWPWLPFYDYRSLSASLSHSLSLQHQHRFVSIFIGW